jgi:uncharacterized delta-60 repeat protein
MKMKSTALAAGLLLTGFLCFLPKVFAAPGDLDTTFSLDGKSFEPIGTGGSDIIRGTALQSDGKIVVAGTIGAGTGSNCGVARYNTDGTFDTSFDGDGKAIIQINTSFECVAPAIQPDGKIVVAAIYYNGSNTDFALLRFNSDGSLDTSFDSDGQVVTPVLSGGDAPYSIAVQSDGKIVVAGQTMNGSYADFAAVRYNTDGSLDTSFDSDGKVVTAIGSYEDMARAMVIQADGKIVVAGYSYTGSNYDFSLVRYNSDGSLDTGFDSDGKLTTAVQSGADAAYAVALQADGKILAAGYSYGSSNEDFAVVRYNTNGSLDTSFGFFGKVTHSVLTSHDRICSVAVQTDGKILAGGYSRNGSYYDFALARYNTNGSLDTSFDSDGKLTTPVLTTDDYVNALVIQTDGKILAAGYSKSGTTEDFALARYNSNGSLDTSFDTDGKLTSDIGSIYSVARAVAIQSDGKIVTAGSASNGSNTDFSIIRYNTDGSFDTSFDGDGKVLIPVLSSTDQAFAVAIQSDGKIVVAGQTYASSSVDFAVVRLNSDGSLDTSFDSDGKVTTDFFGYTDCANGLAIQADGKIVVVGQSNQVYNSDFAIARYNTNGSLDTSFHVDGKQTDSFFSYEDIAWAVAVQSDGKIVVAGQTYNGSNTDFAMIRYTSTGGYDTTFGTSWGRVTTGVLSSGDQAYSMAIQADGKIILGGSAYSASSTDFALARYNTNGTLDTSFDTDGKATTAVSGSTEEIYGLAIQTDGKIVAAGYANNGTGANFAVNRYNANGSLDTSTYGASGSVNFDVRGGSSDVIYAAALDSIGRAVVVGEASGLTTVARILGDTAPRAANFFSVSGRVQSGDAGISGVTVTLTDSNGATRATRTNSFGYYQFSEVSPGTGIITVSAKRFAFAVPTRIVNIVDNTSDIFFTAIE